MKTLLMICCVAFVTDVIGQTVVVNPDGTHSVVHGNVIVNPDGTHSTVHGNVIVNPNGTHSTVHGNVIVNPDGTHSTVHGNVIVNPDGTHSTVHGNVNIDRVTEKNVYNSASLIINQISEYVYQHISFLDYGDLEKISCNGMIVAKDNEAVIFDTPTDNETSRELIDWLTQSLKCKIIAVVPTHYHIDNLGGLEEFHRQGIISYAYNKTIQIAKENGSTIPKQGFDKYLNLNIGNEAVHIEFCGEGHTCDNIIGYFPLEDIMFGGCLIKEAGAGKGNLAEANVEEWSETVRKVKMKYPKVKKVITGHGKSGGIELLDYTIELFE
jgi:metallo-beta-lactamase class B